MGANPVGRSAPSHPWKDFPDFGHLGLDPKGDAVGADWITIIEKLGLPVAALVGLSYGVFQTLKWFGHNIVMPLHQRHLLFLDRLENSIDKICSTQADQNSQIINLANKISQNKGA